MKKYEILGGNLPVVVCELSAGESMITESGSMVYLEWYEKKKIPMNQFLSEEQLLV